MTSQTTSTPLLQELVFIDRDAELKIRQIVSTEIKPPLRDECEGYTPTVIKRIEGICRDILSVCRVAATKKDLYYVECTVRGGLTGTQLGLIFELLKRAEITSELSKSLDKTESAVLAGVFPVDRSRVMDLYWKPGNPYLYPSKTLRPTYYELKLADGNSARHYDLAKINSGTDSSLESKEGVIFHFHLSFINSHSSYFKTALESGFLESKEKKIKLSCSAIVLQNLQHFIYLGNIEPEFSSNIEILTESLILSKYLEINSLCDYIVDLINAFFLKNLEITADQITKLLQISLLFKDAKTSDFIIPCLFAIEKLMTDPMDTSTLNWDNIAPKHYAELLRLASKRSLPLTEAALEEQITSLLRRLETTAEEAHTSDDTSCCGAGHGTGGDK